MRKLLTIVVVLTMTCALLAGCGSSNSNSNSGVIINAGDSASGNTTQKEDGSSEVTSESTDTTENVSNEVESSENTEDTTTETSTETSNEASNNETKDPNALYGTWVDEDGNSFQFVQDSFIGFMVEHEKAVFGDYETDWNTYVDIKYTLEVLKEEPTEEDILNDELYNYEEKELKLKIVSVDKANNTITVTKDGKTIVYDYIPLENSIDANNNLTEDDYVTVTEGPEPEPDNSPYIEEQPAEQPAEQ